MHHKRKWLVSAIGHKKNRLLQPNQSINQSIIQLITQSINNSFILTFKVLGCRYIQGYSTGSSGPPSHMVYPWTLQPSLTR